MTLRPMALLLAVAAATLTLGVLAQGSTGKLGEGFRACPGKVELDSIGDLYVHRIRVDGMSCSLAKDVIRDDPEDRGFSCKLVERRRGILAVCKQPRQDPTVRLRYLQTST